MFPQAVGRHISGFLQCLAGKLLSVLHPKNLIRLTTDLPLFHWAPRLKPSHPLRIAGKEGGGNSRQVTIKTVTTRSMLMTINSAFSKYLLVLCFGVALFKLIIVIMLVISIT